MTETWQSLVHNLIIQDNNSYKLRNNETFTFRVKIDANHVPISIHNTIGFYIVYYQYNQTFYRQRFDKLSDLSITAIQVINWIEAIHNPLINTKLWRLIYE